MNALLILYAGNFAANPGNMSGFAFQPVFEGKNSFQMAYEQAIQFPGVGKTVLLVSQGDFSCIAGAQVEHRDFWTRRSLLEKIAQLQEGFDFAYFAFADCPFLDPSLAAAL